MRFLIPFIMMFSLCQIGHAESKGPSAFEFQPVTADDMERLRKEAQRRHDAEKNEPEKIVKWVGKSFGNLDSQAVSNNKAVLISLLGASIVSIGLAGLVLKTRRAVSCPNCKNTKPESLKVARIEKKLFKWQARQKYHCLACGYRWRDARR